jgi:hypothetical protein
MAAPRQAWAELQLAQLDEPAAAAISHAGAIPQLISLLETGGMCEKKDIAAEGDHHTLSVLVEMVEVGTS